MDVRTAAPEDADAVRDLARRSLESTYPLAPRTIESAVEAWYADQRFAERLDDPAAVVLIGEADGRSIGFSESTLVDDVGEIHWLHVDPERRGEGFGTELFDRTREALTDRGADRLRGRVLAVNAPGNDFYAAHGLEKVGEAAVEIDGDRYVENVYSDAPAADADAVADAAPERWREGKEGDADLHVDREDAVEGSRGRFYVAYDDPDDETPYGYYCAHCESVATAMDAMGRVECGACGNVSKPTRWDAAYL